MANGVREIDMKELGTTLLRIGTNLMVSGASTSRTRMIIDRIAAHFEAKADLFITHRSLTITVTDQNTGNIYSRLKRTPMGGVNFKMVTGISHLSWNILEKDLPLDIINNELKRLESLKHYSRPVILGSVGIADACFCYFSGGNIEAMTVAFLATVVGLFIRQEAHKKQFNPYLCVFFAALGATLVAGAFRSIFPDEGFDAAFSSCVLFLIPGVPIINSITDLFEGNILNGILRAVNGMMIALMIAIGMIISITIYHF